LWFKFELTCFLSTSASHPWQLFECGDAQLWHDVGSGVLYHFRPFGEVVLKESLSKE